MTSAHLFRADDDVGLSRIQELFFDKNKVTAVVAGHRKFLAKHNRFGRARLFAVAAEDTAQEVDFVGLRIPLARRRAMVRIVLRCLDINGAGRAGCFAEHAPDAAFHAGFIPAQFMLAAETGV